MALGPTLETARLVLRPPLREDFEAFAAFHADEAAMRNLGGTIDRFAAWGRFTGMAGSWVMLGFGMFSVIEKTTGRWVGRLGPIHPEGWPGDEIGWGLAREAWGKGYATEGAAAAMDFAFDALGWTDVIHCVAPVNTASAAVARRLGSARRGQGRLPPPWDAEPVDLWGQTAGDWRINRRKLSI